MAPTTRDVVLLHLALEGALPPVQRDVVVDRDLTLAELRAVIQVLFTPPSCRHHVFTDVADESPWSRRRRRWGDRWTMIDFRDPTVVDATTARIGTVLREGAALWFAHTCSSQWAIEIVAGPAAVVAGDDPRVHVVGGEGRAPFACSRGQYEHSVLAGVLADPDDPDHRALRARVDAAIGPWATFDPAVFDIEAAQRAIERSLTGTPASAAAPEPLDSVVRRLPEPARAGLRAHVEATGIALPAVVTSDDAERLTKEMRWLLLRATDGGIAFSEGVADPAIISEATQALACDEDRVRRLIVAARSLRFVYARNRRLFVKKSIAAAAESATALWSTLAEALVGENPARTDPVARDLLLLAIADGSLSDPEAGIERAAEAFRLSEHRIGGYDDASWWSEDPYRERECEGRCDCPRVDGATWHDIVTATIRDVADSAASDGAVSVAARVPSYDAPDAGLAYEWIGGRRASPGDPRHWSFEHDETGDATTRLLREVAALIDLLSLFGLARLDDGGWRVPASLREFARAALQARSRRWITPAVF